MFWNLQSNLQPFGAQTMLNQLSHIGQGLGAVFENIRVGVSSSHIMWGFEYMECCTQMSHASLWLTPLYFWYLKPSWYIFFLNCIPNMDHQALKCMKTLNVLSEQWQRMTKATRESQRNHKTQRQTLLTKSLLCLISLAYRVSSSTTWKQKYLFYKGLVS